MFVVLKPDFSKCLMIYVFIHKLMTFQRKTSEFAYSLESIFKYRKISLISPLFP